eukprot:gene13398-17966_t
MSSFKDMLEQAKLSKLTSKCNVDPQENFIKNTKHQSILEELTLISKDHKFDVVSGCETSEKYKLGILFIIVDSLPNELLWRIWLDEYSLSNIDVSKHDKVKDNIRIWIHAKEPHKIQSEWVKERLVKTFHLRPEWGSLELSKVMLYMLEEAMIDSPQTSKFIFASESCIPIVPAKESDTKITNYSYNTNNAIPNSVDYNNDDNSKISWINYTNVYNNGYAKQQQFDVLSEVWPSGRIFKSDQWVLLSKFHATEMIQLAKLLDNNNKTNNNNNNNNKFKRVFIPFKNVRASDEMFIPCCLSLLGHIKLSEQNLVIKQSVTFSDWSKNGKNPETFIDLPHYDFLNSLINNNHLFFRKLKLPTINNTTTIISNNNNNNNKTNNYFILIKNKLINIIESVQNINGDRKGADDIMDENQNNDNNIILLLKENDEVLLKWIYFLFCVNNDSLSHNNSNNNNNSNGSNYSINNNNDCNSNSNSNNNYNNKNNRKSIMKLLQHTCELIDEMMYSFNQPNDLTSNKTANNKNNNDNNHHRYYESNNSNNNYRHNNNSINQSNNGSNFYSHKKQRKYY